MLDYYPLVEFLFKNTSGAKDFAVKCQKLSDSFKEARNAHDGG